MKKIIFCAISVFLFCLGLFMPELIFELLDNQIEDQVVMCENIDVNLSLASRDDFFKTLKIFSGGNAQVMLEEGGDMQFDDVMQLASVLRRMLGGDKLAAWPDYIEPVLFTSTDDPGLSAILWLCVWEGYGSDAVLWIDDRSQRLVAYHGRVGNDFVFDDKAKEIISEKVETLIEYYTKDDMADITLIDINEFRDNKEIYTIVLKKGENGQEETTSINVGMLEGGYIYVTP